MKKTFFRIMTALCLFTSLSLATAQAQTIERANFKIPFDFTVNNRVFPAGEYTVQYRINDLPQFLRISNTKDHVATFLHTNDDPADTTAVTSKLIFRRYGDQYFLGKIWGSGEYQGHELIKCRAEKELLKKAARKDHLALASTPELITVAQTQ